MFQWVKDVFQSKKITSWILKAGRTRERTGLLLLSKYSLTEVIVSVAS